MTEEFFEQTLDDELIDFITWFLKNKTSKYDPKNLPRSIIDEYKKSIKGYKNRS